MKLKTDGVIYDTATSRLLQEHFIRQKADRPMGPPGAMVWVSVPGAEAIGRERLYRTADGAYWIHEETYAQGGDRRNIALPLTADAARAWLKDRFGSWKRYRALEERVFLR